VTHIVLLGDSVFDNGVYVPGEPDVIRQLKGLLPPGFDATLAARDGAVVRSVAEQLRRTPPAATHLVVSAGGNDALGHIGVLEDRTPSIADALLRLAEIGRSFAADYRVMLDALGRSGLPAAVCTIYDPRFPEPRLQRVAITALALFNDVIVREASARGLPVVDLRLVCGDDADFANPIEPSSRGGAKIARAVLTLVREHDFARARTAIFAR
jgi:hypothetical protein